MTKKVEKTDEEMAKDTALFLTDPDNRDIITLIKCNLELRGDYHGKDVYVLAIKDVKDKKFEKSDYIEITPLAIIVNEHIYQQLKPKVNEITDTNIKESESEKTEKGNK